MKKIKSKVSVNHHSAKRPGKVPIADGAKKTVFNLSVDYSIFAVAMLLLTSVLWAYLSARVQSSNADQLVNSYLFESAKTFHNASLPSAHTFLMKWPLFFLIKLVGLSTTTFVFATVVLSVSTIGAFAYILYRIDNRPAIFGTLCLCLASVLLLIPPQPYAGGILPVNMAMLATRNIEYILYIISLVFISRAPRFRSYSFGLGVVCLSVLGASDKLFLTFSLGGSLLALVVYCMVRRWVLARLATRWLVASFAAALGAGGLLWVINASGLTHIVGTNSPYALIHSLRSLGLGVVFGGLGLLTNFGANPAFDAAILRNIPTIARTRLLHVGGLSFVSNGIVFVIGVMLSLKLYISTLLRTGAQHTKTDHPLRLAAMLLFSSVVAGVAFVGTDHYYVVDARYLAIAMFAVFISCAVYLRKIELKSFRLPVIMGMLATVSLLTGMYTLFHLYQQQKAGLADVDNRNALVVQTLMNHPVDSLVGDYWRVLPIHALQPGIHTTPLENCTQNQEVLSSKSWQTDLASHSFAYLISFDKSLTNFPSCKLDEVLTAYGKPNSSVLIRGSVEKPTELVLFYDRGSHKGSTASSAQTVLPITPRQLPPNTCSDTLMNIVAHEDDDLLFLSPNLIHDVQAHRCVRTVYMTAGDAGNSQLYWLARERGSEAAYSKLIGSDTVWVQRTIKMADNEFVTVANPKGSTEIALIFMRLPDGHPDGAGYQSSHHQSLERLEAGKVPVIQSVDGQSHYTSAELVSVLANLLQLYEPTEIRTQAPSNPTPQFPDHSDHMAVGRYVAKAYKDYVTDPIAPLYSYIGYPIKKMPANVSGQDLESKTAAFLAYSQFDPSTCQSKAECNEASNYGAYLERQYIAP